MKFVLGDRRCYGRRMRPLAWLLVLTVACSGDDALKQSTMHPVGVAPAPSSPGPTGDGAVREPAPAAPAAAPTALTEDMAAPYWTTPDEQRAAQQFALEQWQPAMTAFEAALAAAPAGGDQAARLHLMIGLCAEQLTDWPKATEHLGYARAHLPLLADYIGYHAASAAYFAHQPDVARTLAAAVAPDSIVGADAE